MMRIALALTLLDRPNAQVHCFGVCRFRSDFNCLHGKFNHGEHAAHGEKQNLFPQCFPVLPVVQIHIPICKLVQVGAQLKARNQPRGARGYFGKGMNSRLTEDLAIIASTNGLLMPQRWLKFGGIT